MTDTDKSPSLSHILVVAAAVIFIVWGISRAQTVMVSILVSVFLSVLAAPPVLWLERKRVPVVVSVFLVVTGMICCFVLLAVAVGSSINGFYAAMPEYQTRFQDQIRSINVFLVNRNVTSSENLLLEYINPATVIHFAVGLFSSMGAVFSNIVLILFTVTFILFEATSFPAKLRAVLGDPLQVFPRFIRFVDDLKRYMLIKTIISLATGVCVAIWLSILRVDFPALWGFAAFLLNYIPNIGAVIAAVPAVLLALIQIGIERAALAAVGYIVINITLGLAVETRLMGRKLGLSTLVVFLSLIVWGSLLGPVGAVLCVPLTMTLKFVFERSEHTRWVAVLLGPEKLTAARRGRNEKSNADN